MSNPSDLEIGWLAGAMDGEGCVSIKSVSNGKYISPYLSICNRKLEFIKKFVGIIEKLIGYEPNIGCYKGRKNSHSYIWTVSIMKESSLIKILSTISNHSTCKREQIKIVLNLLMDKIDGDVDINKHREMKDKICVLNNKVNRGDRE